VTEFTEVQGSRKYRRRTTDEKCQISTALMDKVATLEFVVDVVRRNERQTGFAERP